MKSALVIGVDDYINFGPLSGCNNDAEAVSELISKHENGNCNYSVKTLTTKDNIVTTEILETNIRDLFRLNDLETALLYFAGHGTIDNETGEGFICPSDASEKNLGVSLSKILRYANEAYPKVKSSIIILDCCSSGVMGDVTNAAEGVSVIGPGVTILTACDRNQLAQEFDGHGLFTGLFIDGLKGSAADICGRITPASVYSNIDQVLGPWEQRPIYKANVKSFVTLREVAPKVPLEILRKLPKYFKDSDILPLDPSFEPDRENVPQEYKNLPSSPQNTQIFEDLQLCSKYGLVVPLGAKHMYYAAIESKSCQLTALGKHYKSLAEKDKL